MKKLIGLALALGLIAGYGGSAGAKGKAKPVKVMTDAAGDAGNQDAGIPGFDQLGVDLTEASIVVNSKNLDFTVTHAAMPSPGSFPEGARFLWHFLVDKGEWRITAKSVDIGKPDVIGMNGTERVGQVDTAGHFRLEQCTSDTTLPVTLNNCHTVERLEGTFDVASASFTFAIPMKTIKAKRGSTISGGTFGAGNTCQICWVLHLADRSLTPTTIIDSAFQATTFVVPK